MSEFEQRGDNMIKVKITFVMLSLFYFLIEVTYKLIVYFGDYPLGF